jgi:hypothetical protein
MSFVMSWDKLLLITIHKNPTTGSSNRWLSNKSPHQILYAYLVSRDGVTCSAHGNLPELNTGRIEMRQTKDGVPPYLAGLSSPSCLSHHSSLQNFSWWIYFLTLAICLLPTKVTIRSKAKVALLTSITEDPGSDFGPETRYPDRRFVAFPRP